MTTITHGELLRLVSYDETTGVFTARVRLSMQVRPGDRLGFVDRRGYRVIRLKRVPYYAHRLAWFYVNSAWPTNQIDHKSGLKDDNAISNLREATGSQNMQNQNRAQRDSKSGLLGAFPHKKSFQSRIKVGPNVLHLGTFPTAQEAHEAYLTAKLKHHPFGEVAKR